MMGKVRGRREPEENLSLKDLADERKFNEFVSKSYKFLCALAYQILGDWDDAYDAVQNALLGLWQTIMERLRQPNANALSLAYQLVNSRALDILRRREKSVYRSSENPSLSSDGDGYNFESEEAFQFPSEADIERIVIAIEKRRAIQRCGQKLKGRAREVFLLLMEAHSQSEIARMLGMSQTRVSQLVKEVRFKLEQKLREEGWECNETLGVPLRF